MGQTTSTSTETNSLDAPLATSTAQSAEGFDFRSLIGDDGKFVQDWKTQLPDAIQKEIGESQYFDQFQDPISVLKSAHGLSKLAGRALLPGKDASPEDWAGVVERMPRPKEGETYGFDVGAITDPGLRAFAEKTGYLDSFQRVLLRAGVPTAIAAKIAEADGIEKAEQIRTLAEERAEAKRQLVEKFGSEQAYEAARIAGRDALARLYGDADREAFDDVIGRLDAVGLADHPAFVNMLAKLANRLSPGKFVPSGTTGAAPKQKDITDIIPGTCNALGIA